MLGERLKDIRDEFTLKQEEMAKILDVSQSNYSRWENDIELIPLTKLNMLCNYFNYSMDYVIGITRKNKSNGIHTLNYKIIGQNLKKLRKQNGLTQIELAKIFNTSQSTISSYESGKNIILTAFILELVKRYNISLDIFLGRIDNNKK